MTYGMFDFYKKLLARGITKEFAYRLARFAVYTIHALNNTQGRTKGKLRSL